MITGIIMIIRGASALCTDSVIIGWQARSNAGSSRHSWQPSTAPMHIPTASRDATAYASQPLEYCNRTFAEGETTQALIQK